MSDVLSQGEVEALLAALDQGPATEKPDKEAGPVAGSTGTPVSAGSQGPFSADITLYDFKRPERVGKEHMRALQSIHEGFSRNLGASLSGFLRTIVDVKLVSVDQLTYSEFIFSLENPTCFNVLRCPPIEGHMVLEINPSIIYPIIDRLLGGGRGDVLIPRRPLTDIETRLVCRVTGLAIDGLNAVWANVLPIEFAIDQVESNPQLVYIVPPNEVIVLVSFEIAIGDLRGMMNLCIPFNVIEPVIDKLSANTWFTYRSHEGSKRSDVIANLTSAPVDVIVYQGETTITAEQLLDLQVGDILPIEKPVGSSLLMSIGGQPKFRGQPFTVHGRKVIRIDSRCDSHARIKRLMASLLESLGCFAVFSLRVLRALPACLFRPAMVLIQAAAMVVGLALLVIVVGGSMGLVAWMHVGQMLERFDSQTLLPVLADGRGGDGIWPALRRPDRGHTTGCRPCCRARRDENHRADRRVGLPGSLSLSASDRPRGSWLVH